MRPNERGQKERDYRFPKGTTAYLNEKVFTKEDLRKYVTVEEISGDPNLMEVDP
jgi:20S proteasome subunit beta 2